MHALVAAVPALVFQRVTASPAGAATAPEDSAQPRGLWPQISWFASSSHNSLLSDAIAPGANAE